MAFILACDFDGTLFEGSWPDIGDPKNDVIEKVKEFKKHGAEIALWTCREGVSLEEAVKRCDEIGLEFDAVNENVPSQLAYMKKKAEEGEVFATRKIFADFYLDDKSYNIDFFLKINVKETCKRFEDR
jgi:hypothetical protein